MDSNKKLNTAFSVARVFAIISIISAHITFDSPEWAEKMVNAIGSIGVTVFFILSGYFYKTEKYSTRAAMLLDKLKTIGIPWTLMGSLSFLSGAIVTNSFSYTRWITYLLGLGSFLYYLTVLIVCYLLFFQQCYLAYILSGVLTVISVYSTAFGLLDNVIEVLHISNYLNIFNWLGYFALGCYLRGIDKDTLYAFLRKSVKFSVPAFSALYTLICVFNIDTSYFSFIGMPYQLIGALALVGVSTAECLDRKLIHSVSNMTFTIYLIHMPLIGLLDVVYEWNLVTKLLAPLIILSFTALLIAFGYYCAKRLRLEQLYILLTGARMDRQIKNKR